MKTLVESFCMAVAGYLTAIAPNPSGRPPVSPVFIHPESTVIGIVPTVTASSLRPSGRLILQLQPVGSNAAGSDRPAHRDCRDGGDELILPGIHPKVIHLHLTEALAISK